MKCGIRKMMGLSLAAAIMMGTASAQVMDKKVLTLEGARKVVEAAAAEARKNNAGGSIAVVDDGGYLILLERLDNTFPASAIVALEKARTAATFRKDTRAFEDAIKNGRVSLVSVSAMTPLQGGVPIVVEGQVVGAVGVSGAASAQQDEDIAKVAAGHLAGDTQTRMPSGKEVSYFTADKVDTAFGKGAVLLEGSKYMVHASRREMPGQAEVHAQDADIIHVLQGEATLVTGGEVVEGKTAAPGEIRGTSIRNGKTMNLAKGDVVIIPEGTPHWFQEVNAPFLYYVVKVR